MPNSLSVAEVILAVIALAIVVTVVVLIPVLVQVRRTAKQAETVLVSLDGTLPALIAEVRTVIQTVDVTLGAIRELAGSLEQLDRFVTSAAQTVEGVRSSALRVAQDVMPSVATAAGVIAALRESLQWVLHKHDRGRDEP